MHRVRRLVIAVAVAACFVGVAAGPAYAKWGPTKNCGIKSGPKNEHCYAIAYRSTKTLADIAADDNETAIVYDWENWAFYDQEQWVSWPNAKSPENVGWVEAGITEGNHIDCCTAYPFYATVTQTGAYHETVAPGPVESGSGKYNYTLIYDSESNGAYHVYWSSETGHPYWFEVARFGAVARSTSNSRKPAWRLRPKSTHTTPVDTRWRSLMEALGIPGRERADTTIPVFV